MNVSTYMFFSHLFTFDVNFVSVEFNLPFILMIRYMPAHIPYRTNRLKFLANKFFVSKWIFGKFVTLIRIQIKSRSGDWKYNYILLTLAKLSELHSKLFHSYLWLSACVYLKMRLIMHLPKLWNLHNQELYAIRK